MTGQRHSFATLLAAFPPMADPRTAERPKIEVDDVDLITADDLNMPLLDPIRSTIDHPSGSDGSGDVIRCAGDMVRAGYLDAQIVGILLNPANPVSAHIFRQADPRRAALRALAKVRGDVAADAAGTMGDRSPGSRASGAADSAYGPAGAAQPGKAVEPLDLIDAGGLEGVPTKQRSFTISPAVPASQVVLYTAPGGGGKSYTSLGMAASVSLGALAYGMPTAQCVSAYITCEDDDDENHRRLVAVAKGLGVSLSAFAGKLYVKSLAGRRENGLVRIDQNNKMSVLTLFEELRATILTLGIKFLVLDNVAHLFEGNENIRAHVAAFIGLLNALALETSCSILLIGHPNKAGDSYSGSTAWQNQVRSQISLAVDENDADVRILSLTKANYARLVEPIRLRWHLDTFRLESDIATEDPDRLSEVVQAENRLFFVCLDARLTARLPVSMHVAASATYAPKVFATMSQANGMRVREFKHAMERLLASGDIEQGELDFPKPGSRTKAVGLRRAARRWDNAETF